MKTLPKNKLANSYAIQAVNLITLLVGCCVSTIALSAPPADVNQAVFPNQQNLKIPDVGVTKSKDTLVISPNSKVALPTGEKNTINIKEILFEGNTVVSNAELEKIARPFLKRDLTTHDLEELRMRITARYIRGYCIYEAAKQYECPHEYSEDGYDCIDESYDNERCENGKFIKGEYINSLAIIPPQSTANGKLQIKIIEGRLTDIQLQESKENIDFLGIPLPLLPIRKDYLRDRLLIGAGIPLNLETLRQSYQQLRGDSLIERINGNLLPGAQLGEGTLTLDVVRKRPYKLYAGADDYTTPSVGGYTGRVGGWIDNLTGIGERIGADFVTTGRGVTGFSTNLDLPLNAYDTRATFRYNQTHTVLTEKPADVLNIKTQITGIEGGVYHPFYRSQNINLTAGVNFSIRKSYSTFLGIPQSFTDGLDNVGTIRVSVLRLWQQYVQQNANNEFFMRSTFSKGLDVLGATIQHDKLLPSGEFFSWLGQMQYRYIMDNGTQFVAKGTIELAANPLLPLERFAVGGVYSVRGYRENYYVRDNGFYTGVEVRYPLLGGELGSKNGLFLVPFMDYGGAWNNPTRLVLNPKKDYLHSVGIGINGNYEFGNHELPLGVAAELYWAHDLVGVKLPNSDRNIQDNGIHFKISFSAF